MVYNPLTLQTVQSQLIATKGSDTTAHLRVHWNDPVLIKPVLDIGADGIIVPMVRTADDVRQAVAACRYPPEGIRGCGPRRPAKYWRLGGPEFYRLANKSIRVIAQIEHIDAKNNIDEILAVPGQVCRPQCFAPTTFLAPWASWANPATPTCWPPCKSPSTNRARRASS